MLENVRRTLYKRLRITLGDHMNHKINNQNQIEDLVVRIKKVEKEMGIWEH